MLCGAMISNLGFWVEMTIDFIQNHPFMNIVFNFVGSFALITATQFKTFKLKLNHLRAAKFLNSKIIYNKSF